MSLENIQSQTNLQRVLAGNTSASNDPQQWKHDGTETLIKGAELAAAGKTLGMSEEETLAAVSRQFRRQRRADDRVTETDVLRQMVQSARTTTADVGTPEIKGVGYANRDDEAFAWGEDVEYNNQYGITRADDEQPRSTSDNGYELDEAGNIVRKDFTIDRPQLTGRVPSVGTYRSWQTGKPTATTSSESIKLGAADAPAPKSALVDALARLQSHVGEGGYDAYPGSADVARKLEDGIIENMFAQRLEARKTARKDNELFDSEAEEANYYRAEADALGIRKDKFGPKSDFTRGDRNLERMGVVKEIDQAYLDGSVVASADDAIKGQVAQRTDGVFLDPESGLVIGAQGPELPPGFTGDNLNAPQTAKDWLNTSFGVTLQQNSQRNMIPQVDITQETTNFANKVREYYRKSNIPQAANVPANIRSIEELQRVVDRVVRQTGGNLVIPNPESPGTTMPAGNQQASGAMTALGMTPGEQRTLGQALYQMEAARRSGVNQNPTGVYLQRSVRQGPEEVGTVSRRVNEDGNYESGVRFDSNDVLDAGLGKTQLARIAKGSTIGVGVDRKGISQPRGSDTTVDTKRRSIVKELASREGADAQKPFMAQVQGERPRVNRFNTTGESDSADAAISVRKQAEKRAKGKEVDAGRTRANQIKAMLTQERENRDSSQREEQKEAIRSRTPANLRQAGRHSEADKNIPEIESKIKGLRQAREMAKAKAEADKKLAEQRRLRRA